MLEFGITGGIGSGKSTVAKALEAIGYLVYYADDRARGLYMSDGQLRQSLQEIVGPEVQLYNEDGQFMRSKFAELIFADQALLTKVNALVHPAVARDYAAWLRLIPTTYTKGIVFKEAAILFEAGSHKQLQGVITVYAPKNLRLARVAARDGIEKAQVLARMAKQWPDFQKINKADFIIYNDGMHPILPQIQRAIQWVSKK